MINSVTLSNFRNYDLRSFELPTDGCIITGPNGVGKTNLLESIYVVSTTRSFRAVDAELLRYDHHYYRVEATFEDTTVALSYSAQGGSTQKKAKVNDKSHPLRKIVGMYPVVLFEPNQTQLFHAAPLQRRRYLDTVLCQSDQLYLQHLRMYQHIVRSRNRLLSTYPFTQSHDEQLMLYSIQLVDPLAYIVAARQKFLTSLYDDFINLYQSLTSTNPSFNLGYQPTIDIREDILAQYQASAPIERRLKRTVAGPHRDDMYLERDGVPIAATASRGELRAVLLALKYAEFQYMSQHTSKIPILLFDDVLSEFDPVRKQQFLQTNFNGQLIMTATDVPPGLKDYPVLSL